MVSAISTGQDAIELNLTPEAANLIAEAASRAGSGPPTGSIGCEVLRNFVVTLDAWNHRIRLTQ